MFGISIPPPKTSSTLKEKKEERLRLILSHISLLVKNLEGNKPPRPLDSTNFLFWGPGVGSVTGLSIGLALSWLVVDCRDLIGSIGLDQFVEFLREMRVDVLTQAGYDGMIGPGMVLAREAVIVPNH